MKKVLLSITALGLMAVCCVSCEKESGPIGPPGTDEVNGAYYKPSTGTDMTCEFTGPVFDGKESGNTTQDRTTSYTVPETVEIDGKRYTVVSIGGDAFNGYYNMKSVTLPQTITNIGKLAFAGCQSLTSIDIPESVTTIGEAAFHSCSALSSIKIPANVTRLGDQVFEDCTSLKTITLPKGLTSLGIQVFSRCSSLESVTLPASLTQIGQACFSECRSLMSLRVLSSGINLENLDLYDCRNLTSVELHCKEVERLHCESLTELILGEGVETIGENAFSGQRNLTEITIPNSVKTIDKLAFSSCEKVKSLTIGSGVTYIGAGAFAGCSVMKDVYCYAETVPEIPTSQDSMNGPPFAWWHYENTTLHVPSASLANYKAHEEWGQFKNIVAM